MLRVTLFIKKILFFIFFSICLPYNLPAQCCSANPVAGSNNIGLLTRRTLREILFYRYVYSDTYYENDHKREDIHYLRYSLYSYLGNIISYGITRKITVDLEFGYFLNKTEVTESGRKFTVSGLNNSYFSVKYGLWKQSDFECTVGAGVKFPWTRKMKEMDGRILPPTLQPSSYALGGVFLLFMQKKFPNQDFNIFFIHRAEFFNGYNSIYYMKGNVFISTLFLSKLLFRNFMGMIQIRNEYRTRDFFYDIPQKATGSNIVFVSPQVNIHIKGFNLSLLYDVTVYRFMNEIQLSNKHAFTVILTRDFDL